jgi:transcriptional regulator with XRE-family HTH domain
MSVPSGKQPVPGPLARAFSRRVRLEMTDQGITAKDLATTAGLSRSYLGKRLRDEAPFTLNDVEAICVALRIEPPQL